MWSFGGATKADLRLLNENIRNKESDLEWQLCIWKNTRFTDHNLFKIKDKNLYIIYKFYFQLTILCAVLGRDHIRI